MLAASPGRAVRYFSASARVIPVKVTCAMPSSPPKVARPTMVTSTGSGVRRVVVSPSFRSPRSAVPRLTTTSPDFCGARPSASRYGLSSGSVIQLPARVGGPWPPIGSPFAADELAGALDVGRGGRDAGDLLDVRTRSVATGCRTPWLSPGVVMASALRTTASVPLVGVAEHRVEARRAACRP